MKAAGFGTIAVVLTAPPLNPHVATNWGESDAISIKRLEKSASYKVGCEGKMAVFLNSNKSGSIELTLMQTSPTNKWLNSLCRLMEGGPATFIPVSVTFVDTYRGDKSTGLFGFVEQPADLERGNEMKEQKWTIIVERLDMLFGDPIFSVFATAAAEGQG